MLLVGAVVLARGAQHERTTATLPKSVGVVRFANLSEGRDNEYFSEGVRQEITAALGKVAGLQVASEGPSLAAATLDPRALAHALGVDALLEASVQRVGARVRITARL